MSSYFILSENTISEKYLYYVAILKHVQITKFLTTSKCDIPFDSSLKSKYTLKFSISYLLYSSRKLTKSVYVDILKHVQIIKF